MAAYYNEIDPYAAAWLRNLIAAGHIAPGDVDERSIADVRPDDLRPYTQCHFFAGIGVWSYALRRADWPDDLPVWTGSCPCQPFSAAGRGEGFADERHLWPAFHHLIAQRRPPVVFGEQVASKAVDPWIDLVQDDMEGLGYAFGAVPFPSAGVGAPHIRDRAYFVAHAAEPGCLGRRTGQARDGRGSARVEPERLRDAVVMADLHGDGCAQRRIGQSEAGHDGVVGDGAAGILGIATGARSQGRTEPRQRPDAQLAPAERAGAVGVLAHADFLHGNGAGSRAGDDRREHAGTAELCGQPHLVGLADAALGGRGEERSDAGGLAFGDRTEGVPAGSFAGGGNQRPGPTNGFWRDPDWLHCRDGRWRPVEPGTFPLAHGAPARVGRLRAYGNAINAEAAAAFIAASVDVLDDRGHFRLTPMSVLTTASRQSGGIFD